jgi:hypothetical protein
MGCGCQWGLIATVDRHGEANAAGILNRLDHPAPTQRRVPNTANQPSMRGRFGGCDEPFQRLTDHQPIDSLSDQARGVITC